MAFDPGKYDDLTTEVRQKAKAAGILLIVFEGTKGSGFSAQVSPVMTLALPAILRQIADEIDAKGPAA
jgi:NAD(P)H-dependent flavin oxidoreductase YrpB (nitropropane dioxygenase family)